MVLISELPRKRPKKNRIRQLAAILVYICAAIGFLNSLQLMKSYMETSPTSETTNLRLSHNPNKSTTPISASSTKSPSESAELDKKYDVCMVGAGLSGSVIAERYATVLKKKVLILEKRDHIGGNCYDYIDDETGIRVSKYGAHLFHTSYEDVWEYVQQFGEWVPYEHKVRGIVEGKNVPIPVNIETVNTLFNKNITDSKGMDEWLEKEQVKMDEDPTNSEEVALARVGPKLYDLIFKPYTFKQWAKYPKELGPEVLARIPVRNDYEDRYFSDPHQAIPKNGYTSIFEKMLSNPLITVKTNIDYFEVKDKLQCDTLYFTGPIDAYFASLNWPKLEYRSIAFERKVEKNIDHFQPNFVVNHPQDNVDFTRIVEYKHLLNQTSPHTVYFIERSKDGGEPYYPVPNPENKALFKRYREMADKEDGVSFVGRLANYKYFNMDQAIKNALDIFHADSKTTPTSTK